MKKKVQYSNVSGMLMVGIQITAKMLLFWRIFNWACFSAEVLEELVQTTRAVEDGEKHLQMRVFPVNFNKQLFTGH